MIAIIKGFQEFAKLSRSLEDKLQTARAQTEVAKELAHSLKGQVGKNLEKNSQLKKELSSAKDHVAGVEVRLRKKKKLSLEKASIN